MRVSVVCHAECIVCVCVYYLLLWKGGDSSWDDDDAFRLSVVRPNPNPYPVSLTMSLLSCRQT